MTTPARSFQLSAKRTKEKADDQYPPINYELKEDIPEDAPKDFQQVIRTVTAHWPGEGVLTLFAASSGTDASEEDQATVLFDVLAQAFSPSDYRYIRAKIREEELEIEQMGEMVEDMMETWAAFPTQPSSASSPSPSTTGGRSTGRAPGPGSTRSDSLSPAG